MVERNVFSHEKKPRLQWAQIGFLNCNASARIGGLRIGECGVRIWGKGENDQCPMTNDQGRPKLQRIEDGGWRMAKAAKCEIWSAWVRNAALLGWVSRFQFFSFKWGGESVGSANKLVFIQKLLAIGGGRFFTFFTFKRAKAGGKRGGVRWVVLRVVALFMAFIGFFVAGCSGANLCGSRFGRAAGGCRPCPRAGRAAPPWRGCIPTFRGRVWQNWWDIGCPRCGFAFGRKGSAVKS